MVNSDKNSQNIAFLKHCLLNFGRKYQLRLK